MAIIGNRVTSEGDVLIIKPEVPIVGLVALHGFVDTTVGESPTDYFLKEFRYSMNAGITFTGWIELTLPNLQSVIVSKENQFVIEYRYTRVGSAPSVNLEFDDILVSGEIGTLPYPIYNSTFFKDFFEVNNVNVFGWALNVLEKLYLSGILPEYMVRGEPSSNILEDKDFLDFWNTTTHYFAIIVYYARQYRDISLNINLLREFLKGRDIEPGNAPDEDIIFLYNNYIEQTKLKGTLSIVSKKSLGEPIDGELLRLIRYNDGDEFIFSLMKSSEIGWCIGRSSPGWNGTEKITNINKGYEFTDEVIKLSNFPLKTPGNITLAGTDISITNINIGDTGGISPDGDTGKMIPVSPNMDYEISFFVNTRQTTTRLTFGVVGYDKNWNVVNLFRALNGEVRNNFFTVKVMKVANTYYWVRGVIFKHDINPNDVKTSIDLGGENLKFSPNCRFIIPVILYDNIGGSTAVGNMRLTGIKVRPLKTPFTRGQLGIKNVILSYLINGNSEFNVPKLESVIKNNLINANSVIKIKYV